MAELTQAELESKIAAIDTQIATLYANPSSIMDYTIGQKSVSKSQAIKGLLEARKVYQDLLNTFPAEDFNRLAIDVDEFGDDNSENLGD